MPTYRINFVYKDDAGAVALSLIEQVTHAACAHAYEHLDKFRTGDGEERYASIAGNSLCQQSLTCAGRPNQQHALPNARPKLDKLVRLAQELHYFRQFFFGFIRASHIFECHGGLIAREHPRAALTER